MSSDKLTPFSSKVKEIARNLKLVSEQVESTKDTIAQLNSFMADLIILADELGPDQSELHQIADVVEDGISQTQGILESLQNAQQKSNQCSVNILGEQGLGPFLDREVVNPYEPVFSYKESSMSDLKNRLIRLGYEKPELREHLRPVLARLEKRSEIKDDRPRMEVYAEGDIFAVKVGIAGWPDEHTNLEDLNRAVQKVRPLFEDIKDWFDANVESRGAGFITDEPTLFKHSYGDNFFVAGYQRGAFGILVSPKELFEQFKQEFKGSGTVTARKDLK